MENITLCLVCHRSEFDLFLAIHDRFDLSAVFQLVQCRHCRFVFLNPRPESGALQSYYSSADYDPHQTQKTFNLYSLVRQMNNRWKRKTIETILPKKGFLLDYGCGTGEFLSAMARHSWKVRGLEINDQARALARSRYQLEIMESFETQEKYDLVTFWHSLEHIPEPDEVLRKVHHHLNKGGGIFLALPNYRSGDSRFYREHWVAWDAPRHLYHFTPETISPFLESNGFKLVKRFSMPVDFLYHCLLSEQLEMASTKSEIRKILSPFYFCLAILHSAWHQGMGNASSILYYAIKKNNG